MGKCGIQQPRQSISGIKGLQGPPVPPTTAGSQHHTHPYLPFAQGVSYLTSIDFVIRPVPN